MRKLLSRLDELKEPEIKLEEDISYTWTGLMAPSRHAVNTATFTHAKDGTFIWELTIRQVCKTDVMPPWFMLEVENRFKASKKEIEKRNRVPVIPKRKRKKKK